MMVAEVTTTTTTPTQHNSNNTGEQETHRDREKQTTHTTRHVRWRAASMLMLKPNDETTV